MLLTTQSIGTDVPETTMEEEQVHSLFSSTPVSLVISILLELILSASQWNVIGHAELMLWNSIMFFAIGLRTACWYLWRNHNQIIEITHWLFIFRGSIWLSGAAWGCSAFFMLAHYNPTYQALLSFTLAGVASGSLTTLAIDKLSALGFTVLTVSPLTLSLFMEHGPIAVPLGIMSILYIIFVLSAATRARNNLVERHDKNTRLIAWGKERIKLQKLSKSISDAQAQFIKESNITIIFQQLLSDILELTDSKFGFIGEVFFNKDNQPELKIHTLSSIGENEQLNAFYQKHAREKTVVTDMNNLLGAAILKGKSVSSNNTLKDMRGSAMPEGYPALITFVAIPIFNGTTQVAVLSVANKTDGYDEGLVDFLKPVTNTIAQFIEVIRHNRQQKMYEEKIDNNTKHTKAILDDVFDAIITINKFGKIQSFNHAAETIFGYQEKDIINTNINRLIPEPSSSKKGNKEANNQGLTHTYIIGAGQELAGLRRNGKAFPIELAISELLIDNEPIYIGIVRDISERKRSEELKNQFISTVTHELCTPLTSIAGALGILNSGSLGRHTEQQQKLINIAMNNSLRLQKLINDLLDMDKLLSNRIDLQIIQLCIQDAVTKAIESNQAYADKYHVKLKLRSNQTLTQVFGDMHRVQQVCNNLLSNAIKFSPPHSTVEIEVSISGRFAKVTITDHGSGIPEDFKTRIFQRFSQADSSDTRINGGSGLGLAISKELIQRMSGNIGFTSNKEDGSSFYFELPLAVNS
jgi:two-component system, LuxR family, sensor kinase FixL